MNFVVVVGPKIWPTFCAKNFEKCIIGFSIKKWKMRRFFLRDGDGRRSMRYDAV